MKSDFLVVAASAFTALGVVFVFLRWRSRCRTCGAWGQTMSCERCGAVYDPFAPTQTLLGNPDATAKVINRPQTPAPGSAPEGAGAAPAALLQQLQPVLAVIGRVHFLAIAFAVFLFVNAIPHVPFPVALFVAAVVASILKQKHKGARKCPSCGVYGDPKAIHCASCGKQKRFA